jgi:hypothetical protein
METERRTERSASVSAVGAEYSQVDELKKEIEELKNCVASLSAGPTRNNRGRGGNCYNCGILDHFARDCGRGRGAPRGNYWQGASRGNWQGASQGNWQNGSRFRGSGRGNFGDSLKRDLNE